MWYLKYGARVIEYHEKQVNDVTNLPDDWLEKNLALIVFGMGNGNWGQYDFNRDLWRLDTAAYTVYFREDVTGMLDNISVTVRLRK